MFRNTLIGWDKKQLRVYLFLFFLALSIPTVVLIYQAYSQLKWQAFHRHQLMAEELTSRIDQRLLELIDIEESRAFTDYSFLNVPSGRSTIPSIPSASPSEPAAPSSHAASIST